MTQTLPAIHIGNRTFDYKPEVNGWTIKTTATHDIDVCRLLFHYRLCMTPLASPLGWEHGWCYSGTGPDMSYDLEHAVIAALAWDPDTEAEPFGWTKRACHVRTI